MLVAHGSAVKPTIQHVSVPTSASAAVAQLELTALEVCPCLVHDKHLYWRHVIYKTSWPQSPKAKAHAHVLSLPASCMCGTWWVWQVQSMALQSSALVSLHPWCIPQVPSVGLLASGDH